MLRGAKTSVGEPCVLNPEEVAMVRQHLETILASHAFAGSKRTQEFLRLIVRHSLDGEMDALRERMIGAELFGHPVSYDTGDDSVVRVRASEVRKKLAQYYSDLGHEEPPVHIELPAGSYVPRFHFPPYVPETPLTADPHPAPAVPSVHAAGENGFAQPDAATEPETGPPIVPDLPKPAHARRVRLIAAAGLALVLVGLGASVLFKRWNKPANTPAGIHSIAVLPLENLSGAPEQDYFINLPDWDFLIGDISCAASASRNSARDVTGYRRNREVKNYGF